MTLEEARRLAMELQLIITRADRESLLKHVAIALSPPKFDDLRADLLRQGSYYRDDGIKVIDGANSISIMGIEFLCSWKSDVG